MMTRLVSLLCVFTLGGLLVGCGADASDSDSGAAPASMEQEAGGARAVADSAAGSNVAAKPAGDKASVAKPESATAVARLVRTAEITLEVKNVASAAEAVRTTAVTLGGIVGSEKTGYPSSSVEGDEQDPGSDSREESTITLRVPEPKMDDALTRIATVGRERHRSSTTEDVTATIADLDSRVETQTRSVARVRDLLARAKSLQDVVLMESELARREADLESVQARQRALADKATLATITVTLRKPGAVEAEVEEAGFLAGFEDGWTALKASTTGVLTVLGAVLPIAVMLGLFGVPAVLIRRRYQARTATPPPATPAPVGPSDPLPTP
jgi:uncharacterized protein DUF4349